MNFNIRTLLLVSIAMIAFAGNSLLCRLALGPALVDPAGFTGIRLLSGVVVLFVLTYRRCDLKQLVSAQGWWPALFLFLYAASFSYAYVSLETGIGALILFGFVQITLIVITLYRGIKLSLFEYAGVCLAFTGLIYLVWPALGTPSFVGFLLMSVSGIAWGIYSFLGQTSKHPLNDTTNNFIRTIPFVIILLVLTFFDSDITLQGALFACLSGGLTSALGYALWYKVVGQLSASQAGVVQLTVPVIAAVAGVVFAGESLDSRLAIAMFLILGGILLTVLTRENFQS